MASKPRVKPAAPASPQGRATTAKKQVRAAKSVPTPRKSRTPAAEVPGPPGRGRVYDHSVRPIWEVAEEIANSIPIEEWDEFPKDFARNLDHYLYGSPKVEDDD